MSNEIFTFCHVGTYVYTVDVSGPENTLFRCANIYGPYGTNAEKLEKVVTCSDSGHLEYKVIISNSDERHLQLFELNILGMIERKLYDLLSLFTFIIGLMHTIEHFPDDIIVEKAC